jgi:tetratricopeptide (TPR) repeat protein
VKSVRRTALLAVWAVVVAAQLPAAPAEADTRSQALYARGLIPFNSGQWDQAYQLFNQAVQADHTDAVALYYRGLTQARRGASAAAIQDIEQALKLEPSLPHAALDLGILYFDTAQYPAAQRWLERAHQQGSERFTAAFFLGLTLYRLGDDAGAQTYLNEATADPDLLPSAQYYAALSLLRQGKPDAARADLTQTARDQPQWEVGRAAQQYLAVEQGGQPPGVLGGPGWKPWSVHGRVGFFYDSNVPIAGTNFSTHEDDGAATIGLGGSYTLVDSNLGSLRASYDFYQSIHFQLTRFDLQGHSVWLKAASKPGWVSYGIAAGYNFYALDYQTFFQEGLGIPWVTFAEGSAAATQLYYSIRGRDFFREPYDPGRDSLNNAVGVRQRLALWSPERLLSFGYQFDADDTLSGGPQGRDFQNKGNQWDIELSLPIANWAHADLGYMFRLEDYQFPNSRSAFEFRRHDHANQFVVALAHGLTQNIELTLDFIGILHGSNIADFDYDRYIVSAGARLVF